MEARDTAVGETKAGGTGVGEARLVGGKLVIQRLVRRKLVTEVGETKAALKMNHAPCTDSTLYNLSEFYQPSKDKHIISVYFFSLIQLSICSRIKHFV